MSIFNDSDHCREHDMPRHNCVLCVEKELSYWRSRCIKAEEKKRIPLSDLLSMDMGEAADWIIANENKFELVEK